MSLHPRQRRVAVEDKILIANEYTYSTDTPNTQE